MIIRKLNIEAEHDSRSFRGFRGRGFTLVELIISVAILGIMMLVIHRVFFDTANAMGVGMDLSNALNTSRTVEDQLGLDLDYTTMAGPNESDGGGFLMIVNRRYPSVTFLDARKGLVANSSTTYVYSDQLVFIRRIGEMEPIAPGGVNTYAPDSFSAAHPRPSHVRIWYGHVLKLNKDGTDPGGDLGSAGPNFVANQWVLGRQALFFDGACITATVQANFDVANWAVTGHGTPSNAFYLGETDILDTNWNSPNKSGAGYTPSSTTALAAFTNIIATDYADQAYRYAFFGNNRLRVRTVPTVNTATPGDSFPPREIGQMHAYLAGNASDFIVEFAGDYDATAGLDVVGNNIIWYHGSYNPPLATNFNDTPSPAKDWKPIRNAATNETRYVFRHADNSAGMSGSTAQLKWPYMLRIRYRLQDPKGRLLGGNVKPANNNSDLGKWFETVVRVKRN